MHVVNKLTVSLIISQIFLLSGCDRQDNSRTIDELKQQQQELQKKFTQLEKQQSDLVNNDRIIANLISNIDSKQQALFYTELDPSQTRYFILNNGSIALAGRILSISPINDGSLIHISLVNLSSIPLANLGFQMTWGNEKPRDKKDLSRWQQLLFATHMSSAIEFVPGQWKDIDLTLKGISPNNLKYLKMSFDMDNIIFGNAASKKVETKKTTK